MHFQINFVVHFQVVLTQGGRFSGAGAPESWAVHLPLLLACCCASGASSKLAWKCHLIILKTSQQFHGGRGGRVAQHSQKTHAEEKRGEKRRFLRQRVFFCKKTGLLIVRSLKSSYWPRPVEGQERTGFRPPPLGVVGRWEARVGHSLQSNSPEEQTAPCTRRTWVTALVRVGHRVGHS